MLYTFAGTFLVCEVVTISLGLVACRGPDHRHLKVWVPTLHAYFPLATLAVYKGMWELLYKPFFWDKTEHGVSKQPEKTPIPMRHTSIVSRTRRLGEISKLHTQLLRRARSSP